MTLMKRYTYLNGQLLVRELSDCNDKRVRTRAPRNVIRMKKVAMPSHAEKKRASRIARMVNAEGEPRRVTRARLLRERRERERHGIAA